LPRKKSTHVDDPALVGGRLKEAREAAGLSQRQLAFPGCSSAYISRIEAGMRTPSLQVLQLLGQRLGTSGEYLATGKPGVAAQDDLIVQAEFSLRFDDLENAAGFFQKAMDETESDRIRAQAYEGLGQIAFRKGEAKRTQDLLEKSLELYGDDVVNHPRLADTLGKVYAMLGDLNGSIAIFDRCLADAQQRKDQIGASRFSVVLGHALIDAAAYNRAEQVLLQTLDLAEQIKDPILHARLYWLESRLRLELDDVERAARYARKALAIVEMTEDRNHVARAHQLVAFIENDRGNPQEALDILEHGRSLLDDSSPVEVAQYRLEEARALAGLGRVEEATALAMEVSGVISGAAVEDAGRSYNLLAELFVTLGDAKRAEELFELAAELLEKNPNRYLVRVYRRHAELLESLGRQDEAMALLKKAVAVGEFEPMPVRLPQLSAPLAGQPTQSRRSSR
jgi:tetratricopeptide (TPR) repeat protein